MEDPNLNPGTPQPTGPAPTPAPNPAPATEPPKVTEPPKPTAGVEHFKLDPTSTTPALDLAFGYLNQNGITQNHPIYQAALESGNFDAVEAYLLGKGCKDASAYMNIIKSEYAQYQAEEARVDAEIDAAIATIIPQEEMQDAVAWLQENASPEELEFIMKTGETKQGAIMMAKLLYPMFKEAQAGGYTPNVGSAPSVPDPSAKAPAWAYLPARAGVDTPMSQAEYIDAVKALEAKIGRHNMNDSQEYKRLQARFARSLQ